jgi:hypothetical protein
LKTKLSQLGPQSCHLLTDIWTSKQNRSVLGVTAQFIDSDWKFRNEVLGFKHFPLKHSGINIRDVLNNLISVSLGMSPQTVYKLLCVSVMTDFNF